MKQKRLQKYFDLSDDVIWHRQDHHLFYSFNLIILYCAAHIYFAKRTFKMDNFRSEHNVYCRMVHFASRFLAFLKKIQFPNTAQHCSYIKNKLKSNFKVIIVMVDATEEKNGRNGKAAKIEIYFVRAALM